MKHSILFRRRWIELLSSNNVPNPTLPPSPVIVRWNTWFRAAIYHAKHYEHYQAFISNERLNETDTEGLISLDFWTFGLAVTCKRMLI